MCDCTFVFQNDVNLIKEGDKVGASEATLLNMLKISPFTYGLQIQQGKYQTDPPTWATLWLERMMFIAYTSDYSPLLEYLCTRSLL